VRASQTPFRALCSDIGPLRLLSFGEGRVGHSKPHGAMLERSHRGSGPILLTTAVEGLFATLVLIVVVVSMLALANYHQQRTIEERHTPEAQSFAVVASEDGETYELVAWEASCDEVLGVLSESGVEVNFSTLETQEEECGVHIRPFLATTRHPGVRPTDGRRVESSSKTSNPRRFGE
jgi:hypothetical protein